MESLKKLIHFLSPKGLDEAKQREASMLISTYLIISSVLLFHSLAMIYYFDKVSIAEQIKLVLSVFSLTIIFSYKFSNQTELTALIIPMMGHLILPIVLSYSHYFYSISFALVPFICVLLLGKVAGLISLALFSAEIIFFNLIQTPIGINSDQMQFLATTIHSLFLSFGLITVAIIFSESRKKIEATLQQANNNLEIAKRTKDIFWNNISHEIRTPMNGIIGMTNLLIESNPSKEQLNLLNIVKDCSESLSMIVNDVLDYTKLETGNLKVSKRPVEIKTMVNDMIQTFHHMAYEKGLEIEHFIHADVPSGILSDETRIKQIISNFINNSIKFTEKGSVNLYIHMGGAPNEIVFTVIDTGIGIPKDKHDMIFKTFSQLEYGRKKEYGGTGLGLTLSQKLAELIGGEVNFKSQEGVGSEFTLKITALPLNHFQKESVAQEEVSVQAKNRLKVITSEIPTNKTQTNYYPLKILVVEDNIVNQQVVKSVLNNFSYQAKVANNGIECLQMIDKEKFDLILMDLRMPGMDGITATEKIIKHLGNDRPQIYALTANFLQEDQKACFDAGMDDFFSKPLKAEVIIPKLDKLTNEIYNQNIQRIIQKDLPKVTSKQYKEFSYIDADAILANYSNDFEIIQTLTQQFEKSSKESLVILDEAIKKQDFEKITSEAHKYKGAVSNFFCKSIQLKALRIEQAAKDKEIYEVIDQFEGLEDENKLLILELHNLINRPSKIAA